MLLDLFFHGTLEQFGSIKSSVNIIGSDCRAVRHNHRGAWSRLAILLRRYAGHRY